MKVDECGKRKGLSRKNCFLIVNSKTKNGAFVRNFLPSFSALWRRIEKKVCRFFVFTTAQIQLFH
jgi:hypothetical protein